MDGQPFSAVVENSDVIETVLETPTEIPPVSVSVDQENLIPIRYSFYHPWKGGTNCSNFVNGECISKMASGRPWQDYMESAIACPPEWSFGTQIKAFDSIWTCWDRGGAIQYVDGIPWVDFLTAYPKAPYRSIQYVEIIK